MPDEKKKNPFLEIGNVKTEKKKNPFLEIGPAPVIPTKRAPSENQRVWEEYSARPWYEQAGIAADDLARLFSTGATFGATDALMSPEEGKHTEESRIRAGIPGMAAEIGGSIVSPATRAVGAAGKAIMPALKSIPLVKQIPSTVRAILEGATLGGGGALASGRPQDAMQEAGIGAALPVALQALGKGSGFVAKNIASWLSDVAPETYQKAFKAGRDVGDMTNLRARGLESEAFDIGRSGGKIPRVKQSTAYDLKTVDMKEIAENVLPKFKKFYTSSGMPNVPAEEIKKIEKIKNMFNQLRNHPMSVESVNALRGQLSGYASHKGPAAELAADLQKTLANSINKINPTYKKVIAKNAAMQEAREAGSRTKSFVPSNKSTLMGMLAGGAGSYFDPALFSLTALSALGGSPRLGANVAKVLGKAGGIFNAMGVDTPKIYQFEHQREKRATP